MNFLTTGGATPTIGTTGLTQLGSSSVQTENISTGIIRFQIQFIDGTGAILTPPYSLTSTPPSSSNPPSGATPFWFDFANPGGSYNPRIAVLSMVVINDTAYKLALQNSAYMTNLLADFPVSAPTNQTYSQAWDAILNPASGSFGSNLPAPLRDQGAIQVFERHIPLPLVTPSSTP